jgi:hypothetical protein
MSGEKIELETWEKVFIADIKFRIESNYNLNDEILSAPPNIRQMMLDLKTLTEIIDKHILRKQ